MANTTTVTDGSASWLNVRKREPGTNVSDSFREDSEKRTRGWIGVDLDGTLAKSVAAQTGEEIGPPIYPMVLLVKEWLAQGEDVRIFTSRVNSNQGAFEAIRARRAIEAWCEHHFGQILRVTHENMALLFDDRACQVEHDSGRVLGGSLCTGLKAHRNAIAPAVDESSGKGETSTQTIARNPQRHKMFTDEGVARIAYFYWEHRGRPLGSPGVDWLRAEAYLHLKQGEADLWRRD